ncbi:MAG TPA: DUF1512 domain-containing protein [Candidatus Acidoferrum sp.]|nr:DUF1512 domain-containing protein [Candidatus Acidoferrum sp.]
MSLLPNSDILSTILSVAFFGVFFLLIFFSQKIQALLMTRQISKALVKLKRMRDEAKEATISAITEVGRPEGDPRPRLETLLQFFIIQPESMDPAGVVQRLDHLLDASDTRIKEEVKSIAPNADESKIQNLQNLVEAAQALNTMYRVVRHYYLLGKKEGLYNTVQIQMQLPMIMEEAEAYVSYVDAFKQGKPIGDGIGALAASRLMADKPKSELAKEMVAAETNIDGRRVLVTKAKGPGGTVGKPGDAVNNLIEANNGKVSLVLMIDAGLKLEGEDSGDIAEGIGAAIGGIGVEKYKIEEAATKYQIPVYAIIVKESLKEVLAPMTVRIFSAADGVISRLKSIIQERIKEGHTIIVVGVGNTLGIK